MARTAPKTQRTDWVHRIFKHRVEYACEAFLLATFMFVLCGVGVLLLNPASRAFAAFPNVLARRALFGSAMGLTGTALVYSPAGRRSGAHMNPAFTLALLSLRRVARLDAALYIAAQFAGAVGGVCLGTLAFGSPLGTPEVDYVATVPGSGGPAIAFVAEAAMSFLMMLAILRCSATKKWARYTGIFAGLLVALFVAAEAPISGMSINPARSLGSDAFAGAWSPLWIYFVAPCLGMLLAGRVFKAKHTHYHRCGAKLYHDSSEHCIFCAHAAARGLTKVKV